MHSRLASGFGFLAAVLVLIVAITLRAQQARQEPSPSPTQPVVAAKAPIYVMLQTTVDDVLNVPVSMERLPRALGQIDRLQARAGAFHPTCLVQFTGVAADRLADQNDGTHLVDAINDGARRGLVEVGYDGTEEPALAARPRPNLRGADTPEKRYLARLEATQWFLTEWKHPYSGEPDPSRTGGFKRVLEVFGRVDFARGATFEPWHAGEMVHALEALGSRPALAGFLETTAYPARHLDGYRGGVPIVSNMLAADERCAPEVFFLDTALRVSDYGALGERVFNAYDGPEALDKLVGGLDRSRPHVIQIRLGHPGVYAKPGFGARNYLTPLEYAYDNVKVPDLPAGVMRSREERETMYAQEDAVLDWLVTTFFPANAGSRFVSIRELSGRAEYGLSDPVTRAELTAVAASLIAQIESAQGQLPPFVRGATRYFSLADVFGLLVTALGDAPAPAEWPAHSQSLRLFGPIEIADPARQATGARIPMGALVRQCATVRAALTAGEWTAVPRNTVPSYVMVGGVRLTAAQFLRAMAEAYVARPGTPDVEIKWVSSNNVFGETFAPTRAVSDKGGTWTARPAVIRMDK
ncbi:MAG: hypothetical protein NTV05_18255 [Acidobacteria bacterium]|nr:hypothetical protein [Acidobacteriota bacterium]